MNGGKTCILKRVAAIDAKRGRFSPINVRKSATHRETFKNRHSFSGPRAIRAVAIDQDTAKLMGINVDNIISMIFLIGPALGGAAGVMMGLYYGQITYDMGFSFGLKAFTAAIMGGIGNIPGAMVGGILLGVLEAMGAAYVSIAWKDAIAFLVLILILIFRPTGLLGERVAEKI